MSLVVIMVTYRFSCRNNEVLEPRLNIFLDAHELLVFIKEYLS